MTTVILRRDLTRPLTRQELDNNFDNLNKFKLEKSASGDVNVEGKLTTAAGENGGIHWPDNAYGGPTTTGDSASITLIPHPDQVNFPGDQRLQIAVGDDPGDDINFQVPTNYSVKINDYPIWHAGNDQPFIKRRSEQLGNGNLLTIDGAALECGYNYQTGGVPIDGPYITFGGQGDSPYFNTANFQCQLTAETGNGGKRIAYRTKNDGPAIGDTPANSFNEWSYLLHNRNVTAINGVQVDLSNPNNFVFSHFDTSNVATLDMNGSGGIVVQDLRLEFDDYGHVTNAIGLLTDLDGRYYTQAISDARFVNVTGDTMTGTLIMSNSNIQMQNFRGLVWETVNTDSAAIQFESISDANSKLVFKILDNPDDQFVFRNNTNNTLVFSQTQTPLYNGLVMWHSGNDGSGSGLDADLLDGLHATQFVRKDISDSKAGDLTMTNGSTYYNTGSIFVNSPTSIIDTAGQIVADGPISTPSLRILTGPGSGSFSTFTYTTTGNETQLNTNLRVNNTVYATTFSGTATSARYADLAEKYTSEELVPGTFVMVSANTDKEAEPATIEALTFGIVSTNPAYLMNSELENGEPIALRGRVPARIIGTCKKGDIISLSSIPGVGTVSTSHDMAVKVIALGNKDTEEEGLVEVVII